MLFPVQVATTVKVGSKVSCENSSDFPRKIFETSRTAYKHTVPKGFEQRQSCAVRKMVSTTLANTFHSYSSFIYLTSSARLALAFVLLELCWILYCRVLHPFSDIPGPFLASFSRLWIRGSVASGRAEHTQRALHKKYGHLVRIATNEISISDPAAIKIIYNIKSGFTKTDFYDPFADNISPHGNIFTIRDEAKHAQRRKLVNSIYTMSTILESEEYIDACSAVFLEKMARFACEKKDIDLGDWVQWWVPLGYGLQKRASSFELTGCLCDIGTLLTSLANSSSDSNLASYGTSMTTGTTSKALITPLRESHCPVCYLHMSDLYTGSLP